MAQNRFCTIPAYFRHFFGRPDVLGLCHGGISPGDAIEFHALQYLEQTEGNGTVHFLIIPVFFQSTKKNERFTVHFSGSMSILIDSGLYF
jgi:hypothetical protein